MINLVQNNKVMMFSKTTCNYCTKIKKLFQGNGLNQVKIVEVNQIENGSKIYSALKSLSGRSTVPNIYIDSLNVGGCSEVMAAHQTGELA